MNSGIYCITNLVKGENTMNKLNDKEKEYVNRIVYTYNEGLNVNYYIKEYSTENMAFKDIISEFNLVVKRLSDLITNVDIEFFDSSKGYTVVKFKFSLKGEL